MALKYDELILGINGRGAAFALSLAQAGHSVAYFDLSEQVALSSDEFNGPFVTLLPKTANESLKKDFFNHHQWRDLKTGMTLVTRNHTYEFCGENWEFQKQSLFEQMHWMEKAKSRKEWGKASFQQRWLMDFMATFNRSQISEFLDLTDPQSDAILVENHFSARQQYRERLENQGVPVFTEGPFEFQREGESFVVRIHNEFFQAPKMTSFIEAYQLQRIYPKLSAQLWPQGGLPTPQWKWTSWPVQWSSDFDLSAVPSWMAVVKDWDLPWMEENFMCLRKEDDHWVLWLRTRWTGPEDWLKPLSEKALGLLDEIFPGSHWTLLQRTQPEGYFFEMYPLFLQKPPLPQAQGNFHQKGSDWFSSFDLFDMYKSQKTMVEKQAKKESR
ncbi:MAG: hypothetical protein KDD33_07200 [Bdellovibrionales bacterium]|nr:hypothetical protein [Bdellovibrionales bacterium]